MVRPLSELTCTTIGQSKVEVSPMGVGTMTWGGGKLWNRGRGLGRADAESAFQASVKAGLNLFDTAEIYGWGGSEKTLRSLIRSQGQPVAVATKFMPYPWRVTRGSLAPALRRSLARLGMKRVGLYQIHWPIPPARAKTWANALADVVEADLTLAVGVSNYSAEQMLVAHKTLAERGIPLASNQVYYSLLHREPERNGLLSVCKEKGITLIAYSPMSMGLLTGKYTPSNRPSGLRRFRSGRRLLEGMQPLIGVMREIGKERGGKTPAQVALNWVMCKGALPIPGAKNAQQAEENAGALGWHLGPEEIKTLDAASDKAVQ